MPAERPLWTEQYFAELKERVAAAARNIIGANSITALKTATTAVKQQSATYRKDLSLIALQITEDYRKEPARRDELLSSLGIGLHPYEAVHTGDQEALSTVLFRFGKGLTEEVKKELTGKGIGAVRLNRLQEAAVAFQKANSGQEGAKSTRPVLTGTAITTLNDLYADVMSVAKIAARLFSENKPLKARFVYSKILKGINSYRTGKSAGGDDAATDPGKKA